MLFARYAKKPVQAVHSPLESDGMIGKSIIWSVIAVRRFTWIWSLNYDARIWRVAEATVKKNSGPQAWKCAAQTFSGTFFQTLYFSAHTEKN